jgi:hypothetical protein
VTAVNINCRGKSRSERGNPLYIQKQRL